MGEERHVIGRIDLICCHKSKQTIRTSPTTFQNDPRQRSRPVIVSSGCGVVNQRRCRILTINRNWSVLPG